jgi:hypothetical protein
LDYIIHSAIIPNLALVMGTDSVGDPVAYHHLISSTGYGQVTHHVGQHSSADYVGLSPLLVQYYSSYRSPRRVYRCRPHLAAEIGDTVQLSLTEKALVIDIRETYRRGDHPSWQQQITVSDISLIP